MAAKDEPATGWGYEGKASHHRNQDEPTITNDDMDF